MIKSSRLVAVLLSGSALALTAAVLPAQAATTGWRVSATFAVRGGSSLLGGVDAVSKADAWAVGLTLKSTTTNGAPQTTIRHWTGRRWNLVALPPKIAKSWNKNFPSLPVVGASSPRNVWIFGKFFGRYLRLNGKHWSIGHLPGSAIELALVNITALKVFSSTNVWAFGERDSVVGDQDVPAPYAAHYNGSKWSVKTVPAPASLGGTITAVAAVSPSEIWAIEDTESEPANSAPVAGPPVVLEWTSATGWQDAATQPTLAAGDQLSTVTAEPNGDIWFGGSTSNTAMGTTPLTAEWNGATWSVAALPAAASSADWALTALAPDGSGGLWAVAAADNRQTQRLWHLHRTTWSQATPNFGKHEWELAALAQVPHTSSVWAVGATRRRSSVDGLVGIDGPTPR